jgi:RNA polymerase sigma-70 factor (ECF subfamily)
MPSLLQADLDDAMQEAYARIWETVDIDHVKEPECYLRTTVRNVILQQVKRARIVPIERMTEIEDLGEFRQDTGPEVIVSARQELERLQRLIAVLPRQRRRAIQRRIYGLSQREIAYEMGISEHTVEKHLVKALAWIVRSMSAHEGDLAEKATVNRHHASFKNREGD